MNFDLYLQSTIEALSSSMTVGAIASYPVTTCDRSISIDEALSREEWRDYDAIPVRENGQIVEVIEREHHRSQPFVSSMIVSASYPLERFLETTSLERDGYVLALFGTNDYGIVTPSDLLRLPVRLVAFAVVAHLELTMNDAIAQNCRVEEDWLSLLPKDTQEMVRKRLTKLQNENLNPSALETLDLSHKIDILRGLSILDETNSEIANEARRLRNDVSHHKNYVLSRPQLRTFLTRMRYAKSLISELDTSASKGMEIVMTPKA